MATTNILLDCACSIKFAAADLGGGETFGSAISFKADKVSYNESRGHADHSTAQDAVENHRKTKAGFTITVETKLYLATLLAGLNTNDLAQLTITADTGKGLPATACLITGYEVDYDGPSTLKFTLAPRGAIPTFA